MSKILVPIGISNRHVHLSSQDLATLFGPGYQLNKIKDLSQPGQFACAETVAVIGPKGQLPAVRILGPTRKQTQIEVAKTDCYTLGIDAPLRDSGDLAGTPGIKLKGPYGEVDLPEGLICAQRHLHLHVKEAAELGLYDKQIISVLIEGERSLVFHNVLVRVGENYAKDLHIDTDEANAANVKVGDFAVVLK